MYSSIPSLACIHLYGCNNQKSEVLKKTKPTKGNLPTWSTKRTLRPLHQMDPFFSGVANRYASTSKALVRVIKFRYSFTSSSPPSNELLRIKLLLAHRSDQQPIAPFYFISSEKNTSKRRSQIRIAGKKCPLSTCTSLEDSKHTGRINILWCGEPLDLNK